MQGLVLFIYLFILCADMKLRYHIKSPTDFHKILVKPQNGFRTGVEGLQCGKNDGLGSSTSITSALLLVKYTQKA